MLTLFTSTVQRLWKSNAPLTAIGLAMLPLFSLSVMGVFLDSRIVTGAPAWLKPAKFAISIALYSLTLAWAFSKIPVKTRLPRAMSWVIAIAFWIEIIVIDVQAARGVTSHFNIATPLDSALFAIMGISIGIFWLASVILSILFFRIPFPDRALGWAIRWGMLLTVIGSGVAGFMLHAPTAHVAGSHTVGAPDGGPGMAGTGWSTEHGDLRVPHFFGIHGLQSIPLLAWLLGRSRRKRSERTRIQLIGIGAASYAALFLLLTFQALGGRPFTSLDSGFAIWLLATLLAVGSVLTPRRHPIRREA